MSSTKKTTLDVEGMTCGSCVRHVSKALKDLEGVSGVDVDLASGKVRVEHAEASADLARMIAALDEAGYPAREALPQQ